MIRDSFRYEKVLDFPLSLYPDFMSKSIDLQKQLETEKTKLNFTQAHQVHQLNKIDLGDDQGIIEFSEEKGPAPNNKQKGKEARLYLDSQGNEIPSTIHQSYGIVNEKRKRDKSSKKDKKFDENVQKMRKNIDLSNQTAKKDNKYELLIEDSDEDEDNQGKSKGKADFLQNPNKEGFNGNK